MTFIYMYFLEPKSKQDVLPVMLRNGWNQVKLVYLSLYLIGYKTNNQLLIDLNSK
jgi:hypothetical protein